MDERTQKHLEKMQERIYCLESKVARLEGVMWSIKQTAMDFVSKKGDKKKKYTDKPQD